MLSVLCASPGCGLRSAAEKLKEVLTAEHADVEAILCEGLVDPDQGVFEAAELARLELPNSDNWNMGQVTRMLPRQEVISLWRHASEKAVRDLKDSTADHKLLSCHLTLYSYRRSEFYSPLDFSLFDRAEFVPARVLVLIDDVYDMFARLTEPDGVYGDYETIALERAIKTEDIESVEELDYDGALGALKTEARVDVLQELLAWRRADMVAGELLGRQWQETRVSFIGAKQFARGVARWLREAEPTVVYLSHPISRPRREWRARSEQGTPDPWPSVVSEFNGLQRELANRDVLAVMPTAIDEFRLAHSTSPLTRVPRLDGRWPVPAVTDCFYDPPNSAAPEHRDLLHVEGASQQLIQGSLRALENSIKGEVAFRDHLLVAHTDHLLVFRPLYREGVFSDGVLDEIAHWEASARLHPNRRAVFVHFASDVIDLYSHLRDRNGQEDMLGSIQSLAEEYLMDEKNWDSAKARRILGSARIELLDRGFISESERQAMRDEAMAAAIDGFLWRKLTEVSKPSQQVGIWIIGQPDGSAKENERALDACYEQIAVFLQTGDTGGLSDWRDRVQESLTMPIDQLGESLLGAQKNSK